MSTNEEQVFMNSESCQLAPPVTVPPREEHAMPSVSPVLRHRAHELGIDLATVQGTGRRGAITRCDLELAARGR